MCSPKTCFVCGAALNVPTKDKLETNIEKLGLSARARNCLRRGRIECVEQLVKMKRKELMMLKNMGIVTLNEIIEKVHALGFDGW